MRLLLFFSLLFAALPWVHATPPNVVVFYLDDMAYGDPSCYGGKLTPTPHIDSIAAKGVRFTQGYVSACVCTSVFRRCS
ncbi:MAG: sulfatase-like hydrolase/transferase [Verrucomicrobiales bacterium]